MAVNDLLVLRGRIFGVLFDRNRIAYQENCAYRGNHKLARLVPENGAFLCRRCGVAVHVTPNLITTDGAEYYAELGAGEATTRAYGTGSISVFTNSPTIDSSIAFNELTIPSGGTQDIASGFPVTDDDDGGNNPGTTGATTISYRADYGTGDANDTLIGAAIHEDGASGTDPLMNAGNFASSLVKTSAFALRVYVNHTAAGA